MSAGPTMLPRIPNVEVISKLGGGGMGRVYLCRSVRAYGFKKLVAVKVINPEQRGRDAARAMFLDEARLVAQLDHPAIAQVYDLQEHGDALYLFMEFVAGLSVFEVLAQRIRPPPSICASMIAAVCRGLHAAHEAKDDLGEPMNVVHRDVTPSNLMLSFAGQMKILDFGIALMRDRYAPMTGVGNIRGKPTYLSPEQFAGETIDRRTDIYSLSIVLHELLTNQKLFTYGDYLGAGGQPGIPKNWKTLAAGVQPPSRTTGPLPAGLDEVVMRGLAVEPSARFADAKAMALALEEIVDREASETLEAFADRALAARRLESERRLRGTSEAPSPGPRPAAADPQPPSLLVEPATVLEADEAATTRSSLPRVLGLIAVVALVAVVAVLATSTTSTDSTPAPARTASKAPPPTRLVPLPAPEPAPEETAQVAPPAADSPPPPPAASSKPKRASKKRSRAARRAKKASARRPVNKSTPPPPVSREISKDGIMQQW